MNIITLVISVLQRIASYYIILLIIFIVSLSVLSLCLFEPTKLIQVDSIALTSEEGYCVRWTIPEVQFFSVHSDQNGKPKRSGLMVYEDGVVLGPAHIIHEQIRKKGLGSYSHWGKSLWFSSSDNSDPRNNDRSYVVCLALSLPTYVIIFFFITGSISGFFIAWIVVHLMKRYLRISRIQYARIFIWLCIVSLGIVSFVSWTSRADVYRHAMPLEEFIYVMANDDAINFQVRQTLQPFWYPVIIDTDGTHVAYVRRFGLPFRVEASSLNEVINSRRGLFAINERYFSFSLPSESGADSLSQYSLDVPIRASWPVVCISSVLFLILLIFRNRTIQSIGVRQPIMHRMLELSRIPAVIGLGLFALNGIGLLIPLRNSDIHRETIVDTIQYSAEEARRQIAQDPDENDEQYAHRLNTLVNQSILHYWNTDKARAYRIRVPAWENYILYFGAQFDTKKALYDFSNPYKALERGLGMCGQQATVLVGLLRENGIDSNVVQLYHHTVTTAEVAPNEWHVFDPDMNVHIPLSLDEIELNPSIIEPYYKQVLPDFSPDQEWQKHRLSQIVDWYGPEGNAVTGIIGADEERRAYFLKWAIPVALVLPFVLLFGMRRNLNHLTLVDRVNDC